MERKTSMLESIILFALISVTIVIFVQLKLHRSVPRKSTRSLKFLS